MTNIKQTNRGFTIVELLIVIVVIAILAAISIVAYNGIQNRGKASSGQSLASQIAKKAEAYNTIESSYPLNVAGFGNGGGTTGNPKEAKLDDASKVNDYVSTTFNSATIYDNGNDVVYRRVSATGGCVYWWDYAASTAVQKNVPFGTGGC